MTIVEQSVAVGLVVALFVSELFGAAPGMVVDAGALCAALTGRAADTVVVSEEVGLGVHPATEDGRRFRDALGTLNQSVAAVADEVLFVVAGRTLRLDPPGAR